jgi:hypothetical protein
MRPRKIAHFHFSRRRPKEVFQIWRSETEALAKIQSIGEGGAEWASLLAVAEERAAELSKRAELAETREQSHQSKWAFEIDRLREQLRAMPNYWQEIRRL